MGSRKAIFLAAGLFAAGLSPALAGERLSCAADDAALSASFELQFNDQDGGRLEHIRGAIDTRQAGVPESLRHLDLTSQMLSQYWTDDRTMKIRLLARAYGDLGMDVVEIAAVLQRQAGDAGLYRGRYDLTAFRVPPSARGNAAPQPLASATAAIACSPRQQFALAN